MSQKMSANNKACKDIDFYNVCRLCLRQDANNLLPLFHISDNLEYKLYKFCNIRVSIEDRLPPQICVPCVEKVNKCYRFKVQCERSDAFLRDYFDVEPPTDETDSNTADDKHSSADTNCFTVDFYSCKAHGKNSGIVDQGKEESVDDEVQIVYTKPAPKKVRINGGIENTVSLQVPVQKEEDGFRGWPSPVHSESSQRESYQACLKRICTELERELNQYTVGDLQEQACTVKCPQGTKTTSPEGILPQKKFKQTPKKKPEEPQRDYFTRKSWSTLQAKQVQFNNELLKPEHLLLNLGLRPQTDVCVQSVEPQVENTSLGHVTFKTEDTQLTEDCDDMQVENMNTETINDGGETGNVNAYEGIDTKDETLVNSFYQVESEHKHISLEEYSINESIDIKDENDCYYDEGVLEHSNSESEHLNDAPEVSSESLVKIVKEAPQVNVWHWITKHYSGDIQSSDNSSAVGDLYQSLTEKNGLVTMVSETSEHSSPESFARLNGFYPEEKPCYKILTLSNENESPSSEEIVIVSDVEDNIVEDTSTEICDELQETTSSRSENNANEHTCKFCGKVFLVWSSWVSHQKQHKNSELYSCEKCCKTYEHEELLKKHVDWVHTAQERKCPECSVTVHTKRGLQRHMNRHKGLRTHRCNLCHRSFFTSCELQNHFESHLPKQCGVCNKIFSHKSSLKAHVELHAGIGHKCTVCDKIFSRKLYLNRHMQCHSKSCDICNRSFLDNNSLRLHKTSVHSM